MPYYKEFVFEYSEFITVENGEIIDYEEDESLREFDPPDTLLNTGTFGFFLRAVIKNLLEDKNRYKEMLEIMEKKDFPFYVEYEAVNRLCSALETKYSSDNKRERLRVHVN